MKFLLRVVLVVVAVLLAGAVGLGWGLVRYVEGYLTQPPLPSSPAGLMAGLDGLALGMEARTAASILAGLGATTRHTLYSGWVGGDESLEARFRDGRLTYEVKNAQITEVLAHFDTPSDDAGACRQAARDLENSFQARLGPPQRRVRDDIRLYRFWRQEKDWLFLVDGSVPLNGNRPFCNITAGRQSEKDASTCQQHCHGK